MRYKTCVVIWTISFVVIFGPESVQCFSSFLDGIPFISQGKSLVQAISGDSDGAKKTQENYTKQKQFLIGIVEPIIDDIPVIGHMKGAIHMATGDIQRGQEIMKGATKSGLITVGAMIGGSARALSTSLIADKLYNAFDSARTNEYRSHGFEEYVQNIRKKSAKEYVNQCMVGAGSMALNGLQKRMIVGNLQKQMCPLKKPEYFKRTLIFK